MSEDPRLGKPSASGIYKLVACPGSDNAERGLPELPPEKTTEDGAVIHKASETGDISELEGDQVDIAKNLRAMEERALDVWMRELNIDSTPERHVEERLWIRDRKTLELLASAQLDIYYVHDIYALVIDNKTGFLDAPPAEKNWQLLTQGISLWHERPETQIFRVAINASRLSSKFDPADYTQEGLAHGERELIHAFWVSKQPDAPRRPGSWCRYCKAKGVCPEASSYSLVTQQELGIKSGDKLAILTAINQLTPPQLANVFVKSKIAAVIFDGVESKLKAMSKEQLEPLGLTLKPGAVQKKITDPTKAANRLSGIIDKDGMIAMAKFSVTTLIDFYSELNNVSKIAAKEAILNLLGDAVEQTQNAPSLSVIK